MMQQQVKALTLTSLIRDYQQSRTSPEQVIENIHSLAHDYREHNIWIHLLNTEELAPYLAALKNKPIAEHPLWGIPFAIKDNIDLAGIPTTAACSDYAYTPEKSAPVVEQLIAAGAIPIGKTNLDQFATGLNGTRSPWGACKNAFDEDYISGGSSSGSAVAVALGMASFSLGTDTAGSGRVPACFNNLVGLKPTRGLLSASGVVPACRTLDCVSIFTHNTEDANQVLRVAEGFDTDDGYSRSNPYENQWRQYSQQKQLKKIAVIPQADLKFFGQLDYAASYKKTLQTLVEAGVELVELDYAPFAEAAQLLYEGPWLAERYITLESLLRENPNAIFPAVRNIVESAADISATDTFKAFYKLAELKQQCDAQLVECDCLLTPTAGGCFTIEEMLESPIQHNTELGYYTNFMNLLDLTAVAVPTVATENGFPFGITLVAPAFCDRSLLSAAAYLEALFKQQTELGSQELNQRGNIDVVVCGAHLSGMPLNWQLTERGGTLKLKTKTAPSYRMFVIEDDKPLRPGLIQDDQQGHAIEVEVWSIPKAQFGSFVDGIPSPLGIGKVQLANNEYLSGFICEYQATIGAKEISNLKSWRNYVQGLHKP